MESLARSSRISSPAVVKRANEFLRLVESKGSSSLQEDCLRAVCLYLSCKIASEPFDKVVVWGGAWPVHY